MKNQINEIINKLFDNLDISYSGEEQPYINQIKSELIPILDDLPPSFYNNEMDLKSHIYFLLNLKKRIINQVFDNVFTRLDKDING